MSARDDEEIARLADGFERRRIHWYRIGAKGNNPYGLRNCAGCGQLAMIRLASRGYCSRSCAQLGDRGSAWSGDSATYRAAHTRVQRARGKAASCVWGCQATRYQWANLTGNLLDPGDYAAMCPRCHSRYDAAVLITETRPARWDWNPAESARAGGWGTRRRVQSDPPPCVPEPDLAEGVA